tara:strand:+ start:613 stop:1218 length:606 start_codon:yes stop_codon:yes gene_type:complete
MNIFVLDLDPVKAAQAMDCVRVPKMVVESAQMMASALRRHGATDEQMPLTKSGRPYRGGYARHPCSIFVGDSRANFEWLSAHAIGLCFEYSFRFGKKHACEEPIKKMAFMANMIPEGELTPFALAMPDEYRPTEPSTSLLDNDTFAKQGVGFNTDNQMIITHADGEEAVKAYRRYYHSKVDSPGGVHYRHTRPPDWWEVTG